MDYFCLFDEIKNCGNSYQHPLGSTWFILSNMTAQQIYDALRPLIDDKDYLVITEISSSNIQGWMPKVFWDWILVFNG